MQVLKPNFDKRGGIIPVVTVDGITHEVLMLAYTDEACWKQTLATGLAHYFSTSREKSWLKGEESGNYQWVTDVLVDCDGDALVYVVAQKGGGKACHTGARTCFYRSVVGRAVGVDAPKAGEKERLPMTDAEVHFRLLRMLGVGPPEGGRSILWNVSELEARLKDRSKVSSEDSYTARLIGKGTAHCAKKVGEEATEVAMASVSEGSERVIGESADLVYHLLVLLLSRGLSFRLVEEELQRRETRSGLAEKASRK